MSSGQDLILVVCQILLLFVTVPVTKTPPLVPPCTSYALRRAHPLASAPHLTIHASLSLCHPWLPSVHDSLSVYFGLMIFLEPLQFFSPRLWLPWDFLVAGHFQFFACGALAAWECFQTNICPHNICFPGMLLSVVKWEIPNAWG